MELFHIKKFSSEKQKIIQRKNIFSKSRIICTQRKVAVQKERDSNNTHKQEQKQRNEKSHEKSQSMDSNVLFSFET